METREIDRDIAKRAAWILLLGLFAYVLIYPMFASAPTSHYGSCTSNLKQTALATIMYASDSDDKAPPYFTFDLPDDWQTLSQADRERRHPAKAFREAILPYLKNKELLLCPLDEGESKVTQLTLNREGFPKVMSFVHCLALKGAIPGYSNGKRGLSLNESSTPNQQSIPFLRDPIRGFGMHMDGTQGFLSPHKESFLVSFLDGHVKTFANLDINTQL